MADNKLTLWTKFKLLLGAKQVADEILDKKVTNEDSSKPSIWSKLDGSKSISGLLMIIAYYVAPTFGVKVPDIFLQVGIAWAGVGFAHKFDKTTGILTAVMTALNNANKTINGDKK